MILRIPRSAKDRPHQRCRSEQETRRKSWNGLKWRAWRDMTTTNMDGDPKAFLRRKHLKFMYDNK